MAVPRPAIKAYAMLAIVMLLWAGNSIIGRAVRHDIPPFFLALVRWAGALAVVAPLAWSHVVRDRAAIIRHWKAIVALGVTGVVAFNAFLYVGLHHTTATNALLLQASIPAMILALDYLFFRERAPRRRIVGVALSTLGVVLIVFRADPAAATGLHFGIGDGLVLCSALAWALYTSLLRMRPAIDPLSLLAVTFAIGVIGMLPLAAAEWPEIAAIRWRPEIFAALAYVAVLPSLVAYFLFNAAVAQIGAAKAGQTLSLMPLFGAGFAALLLGEPVEPYHFVGMLLILAGIAGPALSERRRAG